MDEEGNGDKEDKEKNKYIMMLNNIVNDLHILRGDLHDVYTMKHTTSPPTWKMYWSDDWLSSAGEDISLDSEADDEKSHLTRSHEGSVWSSAAETLMKNSPMGMKPLPPLPTTPRTPVSPGTPLLSSMGEARTITYLERITKTHPVWFLPEISRAGAVHLLKDKEPGTFIVRQSSQKNTWALSIHQSNNSQASVDHYLIEASSEGFNLQGSTHKFRDIPSLVAYYCQNVDELPEKLLLPLSIRSAATTQQLTSIALLGQDFWSLSKDKMKVAACRRGLKNNADSSCMHKSVSEPENIVKLGSESFSQMSTSQKLYPDRKLSDCTSTFKTGTNFSHGHLAHNGRQNGQTASRTNSVKYKSNNSFRTRNAKTVEQVPFYQSTSMDLLLHEDVYHAGKLCDRMSDYSDVWRSGASASRLNQYSSNSSLEENFYDANSVLSDSPSWTYQASLESLKIDPANSVRNDYKPKNCENRHAELKRIAHGSTNVSSSDVSPDTTPTFQSSEIFNYHGNHTPNYNDKSVTPTNDTKERTTVSVTHGKPPPTPTKPMRLCRLRSNSSPSVWTETGDKVDINLDTNCNEVHEMQSLHLKHPRSSLWVRRWRSLPFRLKQTEMKQSGRVSPFEAISPRLCKKLITKNLNAQSCHENIMSNNKLNTLSNNKPNRPAKPIPFQRRNVNAVKPNVLNCNPNKPASNLPLQSPSSNKFPLYSTNSSVRSDTVSDIITKVAPELLVRSVKPLTVENVQQRASQYDNLYHRSRPVSLQTVNSTATEYCRPWESSFWDSILKTPPRQSMQRNSQMTDVGSRASLLSSACDNKLSVGVNRMASGDGRKCSLDAHKTKIDDSDRNSQSDDTMGRFTRSNSLNNDTINRPTRSNSQIDDIMKRSTRSVLSISMDATEEVIPVGSHVDNDDDNVDHESPFSPLRSTQSGMSMSQLGQVNKDCVCHVRDYLLKLSQDQSTTFGSTVENFVKCTLESQETQAHVVMRNVRQFMNGIKNYLVTNGEGDLEGVIEEERNKLNSNMILNIDAIIEGVLHKCVLRPLKYHLYRLLVDHQRRNGDLRLMSVNVKYGRTLDPLQIGVPPGVPVPSRESMNTIHHYMNRIQRAYSPLKKLEHFLSAVSAIYGNSNKDSDSERGRPVALGADDFLPMLIYVLVDCGFVSAEIEAEYMWGLLHPSILTGEGGYYLTTLSSAVHSIKNLRSSVNDKHFNRSNTSQKSDENRGWMKVVIPDELSDTIVCRTLPLRPNISTKDVCIMLAHKLKVTNPQDYGLFCLHQGEEIPLKDTACPHSEHPDPRIKDRVFTFKRRAAKIAWPKSFSVK